MTVPGDVHHDHPQTRVPYRHGTVSVDTGMVGFLERLWKEGYRTVGSCEEAYDGMARIWFAFGTEAQRFKEQYEGAVDGYKVLVVDFPVHHLAK